MPQESNETEDAVLLDTLLIIVTAPLWLAQLSWRLVSGCWNDWRARG